VKQDERVVVIGSGIGWLATALALEGSGAHVTLVERDPEPPAISPDQAYEHWPRAGVPQFRHAHIFLARMQTTLRDKHPKLHAELLNAGIQLSEVEQILPAAHVPSYAPQADDRDLLHLWGRRATIELVIRRHVERLPHVRFVHGTRVEGLVTEGSGNARVVRGVRTLKDGVHETLEADLVVDASGKHTKSPEWLAQAGVKVEQTATPSSFVYVCRHYRLKDPSREPPRRGTGANLDYLWYGTFYAEHGHFAIAFACPTEEQELARALRTVEGFEAISQ
jgi:2-polyprenyl-6-methoxyphenol hydroxylase-like FAD-dependent oxidoreductase